VRRGIIVDCGIFAFLSRSGFVQQAIQEGKLIDNVYSLKWMNIKQKIAPVRES